MMIIDMEMIYAITLGYSELLELGLYQRFHMII